MLTSISGEKKVPFSSTFAAADGGGDSWRTFNGMGLRGPSGIGKKAYVYALLSIVHAFTAGDIDPAATTYYVGSYANILTTFTVLSRL